MPRPDQDLHTALQSDFLSEKRIAKKHPVLGLPIDGAFDHLHDGAQAGKKEVAS